MNRLDGEKTATMRDKTERTLNSKLKSLQNISANSPDFDQEYQSVIESLSTPELMRLLERFGWAKEE